jgi:SAM-dependent methyltransferase
MLETEERIAREKRLQDERFTAADGSRGGTGGAYAIVGASHGYFTRRIKSDAPGKRLLELGCGLGDNVLDFARCGGRVTGIDLSHVAVENARARAAELGIEAAFEAMDAEATTFADRSFDIVCGGAILHHLDTERAYREIARLLAPGGYALFLEPLGYNPLINIYRRLTPSLRTPDEHPFVARDLELAKRYFSVVGVTYYYLTTLLTLPIARTRIGKGAVALANAVDRLLFRLVPVLRKQAWFIVLELREPLLRQDQA